MHRYVYYACTRSRDHNVKAAISARKISFVQLVKMMDQIDINELGVKKKFEEEVGRFRKFQRSVLGAKTEPHRN